MIFLKKSRIVVFSAFLVATHLIAKDSSVSSVRLEPNKSSTSKIGLNNQLVQAAKEGNTQKVKDLIAAGVDVNTEDEHRDIALIKAVEGFEYNNVADANIAVVRVLIAAGANVNLTAGGFRDTALMKAVTGGHIKTVEALIAAGAEVNTANWIIGDTALMMAARRNGISVDRNKNIAVIRALIAAGSDVNIANTRGYTALMEAVEGRNIDSVRALIAAGAKVNAVNNHGDTAITLAQEEGYNDIVNAIDDPREDLNDQLVYAANHGNTNTVKALIAAGANVNATYRCKNACYPNVVEAAHCRSGDTALMLAVKFGYFNCAQALIDAGANVNAVNEYGDTAIKLAGDSTKILEALLKSPGIDQQKKVKQL